MAVSSRECPEGFAECFPAELWRVGFVFRWSDFNKCWLQEPGTITVKPGETQAEAYLRDTGERLDSWRSIFCAE